MCRYCGPDYIPAGNICNACPKGQTANLGDNECRTPKNVGEPCSSNSDCKSNVCSESFWNYWLFVGFQQPTRDDKKYCW